MQLLMGNQSHVVQNGDCIYFFIYLVHRCNSRTLKSVKAAVTSANQKVGCYAASALDHVMLQRDSLIAEGSDPLSDSVARQGLIQ